MYFFIERFIKDYRHFEVCLPTHKVVHFGVSHALSATRRQGLRPIIAEIKPYSPRHGDLLGTRDPRDILAAYERGGAAALSYITAPLFHGDLATLAALCEATTLPVLRKDFLGTERDMEETAAAGAAAVLVIARNTGDRTGAVIDMARDCGLEPVTEVHTHEDIASAQEAGARTVAINNRDITRFECDDGDLSVTERLRGAVKAATCISASGIATPEEARRATELCDGALVGTALMNAPDPGRLLAHMTGVLPC